MFWFLAYKLQIYNFAFYLYCSKMFSTPYKIKKSSANCCDAFNEKQNDPIFID